MKLFECQHCGQLLYLENTRCERCGHVLGYLPDRTMLSALAAEAGDRWRPFVTPDEPFRFCDNAVHGACNWLVPADGPDAFCRACRLNRTIPNGVVRAIKFDQSPSSLLSGSWALNN